MSSFILPLVDGVYIKPTASRYERLHDLAVNTTNITAGTLTVTGRKPGSSVFETIPDGTIDLSAPVSVLFEGTVEEYHFELTGVTGTAESLVITDTATGGL